MFHFLTQDSLKSNKVCSVSFPYTAVDNLLNNALKNKDFQINNVKFYRFQDFECSKLILIFNFLKKEIVDEFTKKIKIYLDQVKTQSESLINLRRPAAI